MESMFSLKGNLVFVLAILFLLAVSPVVSAFDFDNVKGDLLIDETTSEYGKIEIRDWLGLFKLSTLELKKNTDVCYEDCSAEKEIVMFQEGSLIDEVKFETILDDGTRVEQPIRSYNFYIKIGEENILVDDYEEECNLILNINGTLEKCQDVKIGSHLESIPIWSNYNLGEIVYPGTYSIKLEGQKKPSRTVDWIIKSQGKWINEWAAWGSSPIETDSFDGTYSFFQNSVDAGWVFSVNADFLLINVTKHSSVTAPTSRLLLNSTKTLLDSQSFVGNIATFNYNLTENVVYIITAYNGGSNYQWGQSLGTASFPQTPNNTYIYGGWNDQIEIDLTEIFNLQSITLQSIQGDVSLNSPLNGSSFLTGSIDFNCSAFTVGGANLTNMSLWHNGTGTFEINKTTILSGTSNSTIFNSTFSEEGNYLWNCQACDSDGDCGFGLSNRTIIVDTTIPSINLIYPKGQIDFHKLGNNLSLNWSVTDLNLQSCWFEYNNINTSVNCLDNNYSFTPILNIQNLTFYANDSTGNKNSNFTSWTYKIVQNNVTYNASTYETTSEGFVLNMSSDGSQTMTAILNYNGTDYASTKTGDNTEMLFTNSINIPTTNAGNFSFYWKVSYGSEVINTLINTQNISTIQLGLCNSTLNVSYLNFTFKDEETLNTLNSTMEVTNWRYYLGDGSVYKELTFQNTTENPSYAFCFSPVDKSFSSTETSFRYSASGYPQRIHTRASDLSNTTTNQLLYLLATADGQYTTIRAQNAYGTPIQDVAIIVERQFTGVWTTIGQDITDSAGSSTFWVNPDYDHQFTLSKIGLTTQLLTFRPTLSEYTVVFGGANVSDNEYVSNIKGVDYTINPTTSTLNQSTSYTFEFNTEANQSNLVSYLFNITNDGGTLLGSTSGTTSSGGALSLVLNTGTNKTFFANYYLDVGDGLSKVDARQYKVVSYDPSNMSLFKVIRDKNIDNDNLDEQFAYFFWFFFILFMLIATLTKFTGADIVQPGTVLILIALGTFTLSLGNFFTITFTTNDFINQFGICAATWMIIGGYIMGQLNKS